MNLGVSMRPQSSLFPGLSRRSWLAGGAAAAMLARPGRARAASDTLRFGLSTYPPSLAMWQNGGAAAGTVKIQISRSLVSYDAQGNLRPELAESWGQPDPVTTVFKLREAATFHDGSKVDADAVRNYFETVAAPNSTAYLRSTFQQIARIDTPDAATVKVTLKEPSASFLLQLATYHAGMLAPKSTEQNQIGAGPYRITDVERGTHIDLEAFAGYYRPGKPATRKLRFQVYADENLRVAALQAGDVDLIEYVPWASMKAIEANPKLSLLTTDGAYMCLQFNVAQGPFRDQKLRQAVAYAIRRNDIVQAAFFGRGSVLGGLPIAEGSAYYSEKLANAWTYDPDRARQLLKEAGHPDGFACKLLSTNTYAMHAQTAEVVQQSLAAVGIQVELVMPEWASRVLMGGRGQYEFAVGGYSGDFNDPDALTASVGGGQSPSYARDFGYNNPKVNELLDAGRRELDPARRKPIYDELQQVLLDDASWVGLAWRSQGYALQKNVTGFHNLPGFLTFLSGFTLEDVVVT
jgi:peptide/nickel transport system substrate-binding protein